MFLFLSLCTVTVHAGIARHTFQGLEEGVPPDTEVVSNVALRVAYERLTCFSLKLEAGNGTTNEVLVAVGNDADGDGDLSPEEADFAWGLDCGVRYLADYRTGNVFLSSSGFAGLAGFAVAGDTLIVRKNDFSPAWNRMKIIKRGAGVIGERVTVTRDTVSSCIFLR